MAARSLPQHLGFDAADDHGILGFDRLALSMTYDMRRHS